MSIQLGDGLIYQRLAQLHPRLLDLSLERLQRLLAKLGHPEERLPPVIHVAGTNGKGSTSAFCRAMLEAAGNKVHVYTSPHLVRFNERIRLAGKLVEDEELYAAFEHCERVNNGDPITFFEITTAAALYLFAETPADYTILEVGMGGRFDATNVVPEPLLSIITPVSYDHQEFLGDTLKQIAGEKAGILKKNIPCVVSMQPDEAMLEIVKISRQARAPLLISGEHWSVSEEHGRLLFQDDDALMDLPPPKLLGRHQYENAGAAIAAMRAINRHRGAELIQQNHIEQGLKSVSWPARMQRITAGALIKKAPKEAEVWLDGGHNESGGEAISEFMAEMEDKKPRPLFLICGMLTSKDANAFLKHFVGLAAKVLTVSIPETDASHSAEDLMVIALNAGLDAAPMPDVATALSATAALDAAPRILICGSLYLAGHVLKENGTLPS